MDLSSLWESLQGTLGETLPSILGGLAVLVLGWFVAVIGRAVVRKSLGLTHLNERVTAGAGGDMDLEAGLARGVFYLILLFTLVAFFNVLGLSLVSAPLQSLVEQLLGYVPNMIAGGLLVLVAWLVATVLRRVAIQGLASTRLDEKLSQEAGMKPMSGTLGDTLYGLVFLLFLPAILEALGMQGLLVPIQGMLNEMLSMLPNVLAAVLLGGIGWFLAHLLRNLVANLLAAAGADRLGEKIGLEGATSLSKLAGLLVFIFVFVPSLIAALDAVQLEVISGPATQMLGIFMATIPSLFAAAVILAIAFLVGRLLGDLGSSLLGGMGFDNLPAKLGLMAAFPEGGSPSNLVGKLIVFFVVLFATVEAASVVGFVQVSGLVATFLEFGGQVLLGVVIIGVGLWISNLAHGAISRLGRPNSAFMASLVRFSILGIVLAMGLRAMGIANDIVNLAFALTLGALAVAVALSFGLGGREAAGRQMEYWLAGLRGE